eukprot:164782-Chlamydomonas_euryale.AAC.1
MPEVYTAAGISAWRMHAGRESAHGASAPGACTQGGRVHMVRQRLAHACRAGECAWCVRAWRMHAVWESSHEVQAAMQSSIWEHAAMQCRHLREVGRGRAVGRTSRSMRRHNKLDRSRPNVHSELCRRQWLPLWSPGQGNRQ